MFVFNISYKLNELIQKLTEFDCIVVVAYNTMAPHHKCSDKCPKDAKNGPKMKCCSCDNVCYLQCFGFEAGPKIDGLETVKATMNGSFVIATFLTTMALQCCSNTMTTSQQKTALKLPTTARSTSNTRSKNESEQTVVKELHNIKEMLASLKNATDANTAEITAIKSLSTQTDANVKKVSEQNAAMNNLSTPVGSAMKYVNEYRNRSYASAAAQSSQNAKRKRSESDEQQKMKFPEPKVGTKPNAFGLKIVPKMINVRDDKPMFEKALYVSRLDPATSNDQLTEYIVANTPVTDATKFKIHKMVKKGTDESTLKFVSFKVELNAVELDILDNVDLWPEGVRVREFQVVPKNDLGKHFPTLPKPKPIINDAPTDQMET